MASIEERIAVKQAILASMLDPIMTAAEWMTAALHAGHKLLLFGNGGSAADAQHIAAEFVGRFETERRAWPAIALTTDTSILTALGNDYGVGAIFARQIEALGRAGDLFVQGNASPAKLAKLREYPVRLHPVGSSYDDAEQAAL